MEVHQLIKNLCQVLKLLNVKNLKPECFRRAKHNQDKSNEILFNLLHKAIVFIEINVSNSSEDDLHFSMVESRLKALGYSGNIVNKNSREILIAFSWLLASYALVDDLILHMFSTSPLFSNDALILLMKKSPTNEDRDVCMLDDNRSEERCIDDLMYLSQKLDYGLKLCQIAEEEKMFLLFKIEKFVENDKDVRRLILSKNPELHAKLHSEYEKLHNYVEAYFNWKNNENTFWKWMESVLQLRCLKKKLNMKVPVFVETPDHVQDKLEELKINFQNFNRWNCAKSENHLVKLGKYLSSINNSLDANEEEFSDLLMGSKFKHSSGSNHSVQTFASGG